jgi:hypothetical protein
MDGTLHWAGREQDGKYQLCLITDGKKGQRKTANQCLLISLQIPPKLAFSICSLLLPPHTVPWKK